YNRLKDAGEPIGSPALLSGANHREPWAVLGPGSRRAKCLPRWHFRRNTPPVAVSLVCSFLRWHAGGCDRSKESNCRDRGGTAGQVSRLEVVVGAFEPWKSA